MGEQDDVVNFPARSSHRMIDRLFLKLKRKTNSNFFIPQIDGLRFLAISLVVLIHINVFYLAKNILPFNNSITDYPLFFSFLYNGFKGVELFFVISGFILAMPFAKHYLHNGNKVLLKEYFLRRLTRLEPPYVLAMLFIFFVFIIIGKFNIIELFPSLLSAITYTHNFFDHLPSLSGITWSLEIELQFYLIVPALSLVFSLNKLKRRAVMFGSIVLFPIFQNFFLPNTVTLYNYLQFFLVGFLLADLYLSGFRFRLPKIVSLLIGFIALFVIIFMDFSDPHIGVVLGESLLNKIIFPFVIFLFYILVITDDVWKNLFSNRIFTSIGGMCYTIYLWHMLILSAVGNKLMVLNVANNFLLDFLFKMSVLFILVILFSAIPFLIIEKPTMDKDWPRKLYHFFKFKFLKHNQLI